MRMTPAQSRVLKARIASALAADAWLSRRAERLRVQPWDEEDFLVSVFAGQFSPVLLQNTLPKERVKI